MGLPPFYSIPLHPGAASPLWRWLMCILQQS